jgi:predicted nuclease of predicted toxin-antitoxin system
LRRSSLPATKCSGRTRFHALPDVDLIEQAGRERRAVITFDKDFGELVFRRGHSVGVVLIRLRETSMREAVALVMELVNSEAENLHHLFCVIENSRIRKTPLPR